LHGRRREKKNHSGDFIFNHEITGIQKAFGWAIDTDDAAEEMDIEKKPEKEGRKTLTDSELARKLWLEEQLAAQKRQKQSVTNL
jgi:hypothetical protein